MRKDWISSRRDQTKAHYALKLSKYLLNIRKYSWKNYACTSSKMDNTRNKCLTDLRGRPRIWIARGKNREIYRNRRVTARGTPRLQNPVNPRKARVNTRRERLRCSRRNARISHADARMHNTLNRTYIPRACMVYPRRCQRRGDVFIADSIGKCRI